MLNKSCNILETSNKLTWFANNHITEEEEQAGNCISPEVSKDYCKTTARNCMITAINCKITANLLQETE